MLIYKQRYKPRTTREFTKSDLTVYDSAGNTALNALTVYGKSKVVNGEIVSAGEGWTTVDLGTLTWGYNSSSASNPFFYASDINIKLATSQTIKENLVCKAYNTYSFNTVLYDVNIDKAIGVNSVDNAYKLVVKNTDYTDATAFKTAMNGVKLVYELADPTQGNCIAVKTDNGSGINGTMAVFTTGTPLCGIPDTDVRDVMLWYETSGTVTKKCNEIDLGTRIWTEYGSTAEYTRYVTGGIDDKAKDNGNCLCAKYNSKLPAQSIEPNMVWISNGNAKLSITTNVNEYASASDFKTAMNGVKLVYELATPTTEQLTSTENDSIAGLRTFEPQTHAQNNAGAEMTVDYTIRVPTI